MARIGPLPKAALIVAIWLAFGLRVYHLGHQSIWWDEGHSIAMASAPLSAIASLPGMDVHPPGYFWMLHVWMGVFGSSEYSLRFLSLIFSVLTVSLAARFAGDLLPGSRWAIPVTCLFAAIYPFSLAYAQEVRMYSLAVCLGTLGTFSMWRTVRSRRQPGNRSWLWPAVYAMAMAAALYTHYFSAFLIVFHNAVWFVWTVFSPSNGRSRGSRLLVWLGSQVAALLLFAPQLGRALAQTTSYANPNLSSPGLWSYLSRCWMVFSVGPVAGGSASWLAWLSACLTGVLIVLLLLRGPRSTRVRTAFLAGWLVVPIALYFLVLQMRPSFEARYLAQISPALLLLWSWGTVRLTSATPVRVSAISRPRSRPLLKWRLASAPILCVLGLVLGARTFGHFAGDVAAKDDSRGVADWLATHTTAEDLVYVDVPHPFHYYADRIPATTEYLFVDVHTAAETLGRDVPGRRHVFWVTWRGSDTDPRGVIPFLLDKAGARLGEKDFRGYHLTWWSMPADPQFSLPQDLSPVSTVFGGTLLLDGVSFTDTVHPGANVSVTCHYSIAGPVTSDLRASLRLRDTAGISLSPTDKDILNDRHFRTSAWPATDPRLNQAINVYTIRVPADVSPGTYFLEMVVYDATDQEALWVNDPTSPDGISARLGQVVLLP